MMMQRVAVRASAAAARRAVASASRRGFSSSAASSAGADMNPYAVGAAIGGTAMYLVLSVGGGEEGSTQAHAAPAEPKHEHEPASEAEAAQTSEAAAEEAGRAQLQNVLSEIDALEQKVAARVLCEIDALEQKLAAAESAKKAAGKVAANDAATATIKLLLEGAVVAEARIAELEDWRDTVVATEKNRAFVFVKPHAVTENMIALVKEKLAGAAISVVSEGSISAEQIDRNSLIDKHYGAIASKAVQLKPAQLNVPEKGQKEFAEAFGISWQDALDKGMVFNAADACGHLGVDASGLDEKWSQLKRGKTMIKFGGGFYAGQVDGLFVINGFYAAMRSKYTSPDASIHYFLTEWDPSQLSWDLFREKILGGTDPATAEAGSLRSIVLDKWEELGLPAKPDVGDNGVHASASPLEAMAERSNWLQKDITQDVFAKGMLSSGISISTIKNWSTDPQVAVAVGSAQRASLFDLLEDTNAGDCLAKAKALDEANVETR